MYAGNGITMKYLASSKSSIHTINANSQHQYYENHKQNEAEDILGTSVQ